jgi:hypothetical protein
MSKRYQVVVGNVGTTLETNQLPAAQCEFDEYVWMSKHGVGRASHEDVTLMERGDPIKEFIS